MKSEIDEEVIGSYTVRKREVFLSSLSLALLLFMFVTSIGLLP